MKDKPKVILFIFVLFDRLAFAIKIKFRFFIFPHPMLIQ